jgi:hypothetical protein
MFFGHHQSTESETALLQRAAAWPNNPILESLTAATLHQIAQQEGVDFATALFFDRFQKSPARAKFIQRINTLSQSALPPRHAIDAQVVIVPGALYLERPDIGGDGRLVREVTERFGWDSDLIPLASVGSLAENARRICDWLAHHSAEQIILVSLSKGGAEIKMALADPNASVLFRKVVAWINVCGPLNGSRMANWILASRVRTRLVRLQYRLQQRDFRFITDLRHGANSPLNFAMRLPPGIKLVNLIGFPLRQHLTTPFSRFYHRTLATYGPNDGTILLSDLHQWPGDIYPVWGADHFFRPENKARDLIAAVLRYLAEELAPDHNACNVSTAAGVV